MPICVLLTAIWCTYIRRCGKIGGVVGGQGLNAKIYHGFFHAELVHPTSRSRCRYKCRINSRALDILGWWSCFCLVIETYAGTAAVVKILISWIRDTLSKFIYPLFPPAPQMREPKTLRSPESYTAFVIHGISRSFKERIKWKKKLRVYIETFNIKPNCCYTAPM